MAIEAARLAVVVEGDTKGAEKGLARVDEKFGQVGQRLQQAGQRISSAGATMTRNLTLPIIGAGAAIVGVGQQFEATMGRIEGLVGIPADEVERLGEAVLELAPKVGKGPNELAEALFTVTSAGFRGADAMGVLEEAAKASAAGLGDTRSIAEAATGVINAYGSEVIDAARATEIVTATARAGNFATEDLAGALGRVTPFAQAAGASFEDVGGAIALLTRVNNDAQESVTQTASLMRAFSAPTKQTQAALEDLSLTTQDVRDMMSEQGLAGTLQELDKRLGGNRDALREIIPDSQGFSAALTILNADAETLDATFGDVADSAGITDEAFAAAEKTTRQKFDKAMARAQATLIKLSADALPAVADALEVVSDMLDRATDWWESLDDTTQKNIIRAAALVAALGPVVWIVGKVISVVGTLITVVKSLSVAMAFLAANPIVLVIAAVAALVAGLVIAYRTSERFRNIVNGAFETVMDAGKRMAANLIGGLRMIMDFFLGWADNLISTAARAFGWIPGIGGKLEKAAAEVKRFREKANAEMNAVQTSLRYSADVSPAMRQIYALRQAMRSIPQAATIQFGGTRGGVVMHEGGWVPGPSTAEVPALLQGGEFVVSHDMLNRGGGPGGDTVITVNGFVGNEKQLADEISEMLRRREQAMR